MTQPTIYLERALRRTVLQGHPWIFRQAIRPPKPISQATLCQVDDKQGFLAWAIYDPHSVLALRILSFGKEPPTVQLWRERLSRSWALRRQHYQPSNNACRLVNGEGDGLPGLVIDLYDHVAVIQCDGQGASEFWDLAPMAQWLLEQTPARTVVHKPRRQQQADLTHLAGDKLPGDVVIQEEGVHFLVDIAQGQKTGFFLDQRLNRHYLRQAVKSQRLLNLFSYSGGFSVHAGLGGASNVTSVDISAGALNMATKNWQRNGLADANHQTICTDAFDFLKQPTERWDHIVVDPPSLAPNEEAKESAKQKYQELFTLAAKRLTANGELCLSSCSSHISQAEFLEIIGAALSAARCRAQILYVGGQAPDHPWPHACQELRYLKFVHLLCSS